MFRIKKLCLLGIGTLVVNAAAQFQLPEREIHYRPGDWVSYPVTRYATSIDLGHQYVYFGSTGGIARYDFYRNDWEHPFTVSDGLDDDRIRVVLYDFPTGYLWCATETGVSYRTPSSEEWRNLSYQTLRIDPVSSLGSGNEYLWLESSGQLLKGNRIAGDFRTASPEEEAVDAVRWRGSFIRNDDDALPDLFIEGGYLFFPEGYIQDPTLRQFDVVATYQDRFDNLWMATWGLGGAVADMKTFWLDLLPFGPYISEVDAMAWEEDGMWLGGAHPEEPGGITFWDMDIGTWRYFEAKFISQLRNDEITVIAPDTTFVWFGTRDGLTRYNKRKDTWRTFGVHDNLWDDRIYDVALGEGILWVATEYGINRILLPGMVVEKIQDKRLVHLRIHKLAVDGENVWAGTDRGIFRYVGEKGFWEYVPAYAGMIGRIITAVSVWQNEVWFGTTDGVEVYDKKKNVWQGFPPPHYPTNGIINTILADSAAVWVGTENGVLKYNKHENRWRRFTTEDGLLDDSVRWILLDGDHVWFGTKRGLTRFYWNAPYRID